MLLVSSFYDLRERRIPDILTYGATVFGILYWLFLGNYAVLLYAASTFLVAYLLYRIGMWAGGDVKLFTAVAALNPHSVPLFGLSLPFPLALFIASVFVAFLLTFPWMLWRIMCSEQLRKNLMGAVPLLLRKSFVVASSVSVFGPIGLLFSLLPFPTDVFSALALFLWSPSVDVVLSALTLFLAGLFFRVLAMRTQVFRKVKKVEELEDGDVPADFVLDDGRVIPFSWRTAALAEIGRIKVRYSPLRAAGLYPEDIEWLKKKGVKEIAVRTTTPFVPFVTVAYILLLLANYFGA